MPPWVGRPRSGSRAVASEMASKQPRGIGAIDTGAFEAGNVEPLELAAEMRAGRAVVMEQVPLFDRAMNGLMGALRV